MLILFAHNFIINHCAGSPRFWRQITEFSVCPHSKKLPPLSSSALLLKAGQTSDSASQFCAKYFAEVFVAKMYRWKVQAIGFPSIHPAKQNCLSASIFFTLPRRWPNSLRGFLQLSKKRAVKLRSPTATETRQLGFVKHLPLHDCMITWQFLSQEHENLWCTKLSLPPNNFCSGGLFPSKGKVACFVFALPSLVPSCFPLNRNKSFVNISYQAINVQHSWWWWWWWK